MKRLKVLSVLTCFSLIMGICGCDGRSKRDRRDRDEDRDEIEADEDDDNGFSFMSKSTEAGESTKYPETSSYPATDYDETYETSAEFIDPANREEITFGKYRGEDIEWIVIDERDGKKLLL